MKTISRRDAETRRPTISAALRLCGILFLAGAAEAADLARVDALLVQAQALLGAAREELQTTNPTNDTNADATSAIRLESFAWSGKKTSDPAGLPSGARYGEGVEGGKRFCQWSWPTLILHAVMPAATTSATGKSVAWYHFTRTATPFPALSSYSWRNTHRDSDAGGVWYRWAGGR